MVLKFWWLLKKSVMGIMNLIATAFIPGCCCLFQLLPPLAPERGTQMARCSKALQTYSVGCIWQFSVAPSA